MSLNPSHSRSLQLLAAGARETLQRYAITFWLLSANPAINRSSLEKESRTVAQRLSVLHGINAPEFFDKAVFSTLVLTLRDEGYISDTGDAEPEETLKVYRMLADLITSDVRRVTRRLLPPGMPGGSGQEVTGSSSPGRGTAPARRSYCS